MEDSPFIDDFPIKTSIYKGFSMAMLNNQMVSIIPMTNFGPMAPLRISAGGVRMHRARLGAEGRAHLAGGGARRHAQDLGRVGGDGGKMFSENEGNVFFWIRLNELLEL